MLSSCAIGQFAPKIRYSHSKRLPIASWTKTRTRKRVEVLWGTPRRAPLHPFPNASAQFVHTARRPARPACARRHRTPVPSVAAPRCSARAAARGPMHRRSARSSDCKVPLPRPTPARVGSARAAPRAFPAGRSAEPPTCARVAPGRGAEQNEYRARERYPPASAARNSPSFCRRPGRAPRKRRSALCSPRTDSASRT